MPTTIDHEYVDRAGGAPGTAGERPSAADVDVRALADDLRACVSGEVRFSRGDCALYATDASNYRQLPIGVVVPRTVEDVEATVAACRRHGAPIVSRGGGTSLAGQCCNTAVVIDFSKYLNKIITIDPDARTARVQPGLVLDELRSAAGEHGLTFGPDPATHAQCTLGGMIGNNSCGVHALMAGKTADNVEWLDVLLYDGTRMRVGATSAEELERIVAEGGRRGEVHRALRELRDRHLACLRTGFPELPRRVSGYNLDALLPENDFHVAQALVGTEGTCAVVLEAGLRLVTAARARTLVVLGFADVGAAADAVPDVLEFGPIGLEGLDDELYRLARSKSLHPDALALFPDGGAWLIAEFGADDVETANRRARDVCERLGSGSVRTVATRVFDDPDEQERVWAVRESGLAATSRTPEGVDNWPGWEDSAVRPEDLGDYLRDLKALYDKYDYRASLYGHFGQGCVHSRIPFQLTTAEGIAKCRAFLQEAAELCCGKYGGSLSGEHGDGQARGELLPVMYDAEMLRAFGEFKAIWDPEGRMNPGKVVDPYPIDSNLRLGTGYAPPPVDVAFGYPEDDGSFAQAANRCVGVGKCRQPDTEDGSVMCPSYQVTREEKHSTRGRARLLWEMLNGALRPEGWRSKAVLEALDLCLACKGCKSDCPVNVDMATYKAEFLSHHYAGRLRPRTHYSMGWLPLWARAASVAPRAANAVAAAPILSKGIRWAAGVPPERELPIFARQQFVDWFRSRPASAGSADRPPVLLWPDTFTNSFNPEVGRAAVQVLEAAGARVVLPDRAVCCGLPWISTGQLGIARRVLRHSIDVLAPHVRAGTPVVGLEPSCAAVLRSDARDLFRHDQDVARLVELTQTLGGYLQSHHPEWQPPQAAQAALVQVHCHHHAVLGFGPDHDLATAATGGNAEVLNSGCCGLAGNFGFERGHYDVSRAVGERVLLPAVRSADAATAVVADGFSCRTQIEQGDTGRRPVHLAELLATGLGGRTPDADWPEGCIERPSPPSRAARWAATGGVAAITVGALRAAAVARRR